MSIEELEKVDVIDQLLSRKIKAFRVRMKDAHNRGKVKLAELRTGSAEFAEWEARIKDRRRTRKKEYRRLLEKAHAMYSN